MNGAFDIAAIGLRAQRNALDILANNIANINTPAFKRSDVRFEDMVATRSDLEVSPANLERAPGFSTVRADAHLALDIQGEIVGSSEPMDLAIDGEGFIELLGPRGQTFLWRGGRLGINEDGQLSGPDGMALGAMIAVPANAFDISISAEGVVSARVEGDAARVALGQIALVTLDHPSAVTRTDNGLYLVNDRSAVSDASLDDGASGQFAQGAIERSNVDLGSEMVQLMIVQRAFAANAQVVQAADQIMAIANTLRR